MTTEFANIELSLIVSSLTNPRKNFNPTKLAELAEDIKRRGIDTPITVRPLPGSRVADTDRTVQFELVCGERRLRASQLAGVATIPTMVRALTDDQALEIQLCENLKRDDLTELEEAEGYETLMQHANINADQVGERIGKSRSYVYGRIKLLDLCSEARVSLRDGTIDASRALVVARIPDHKLQIKAMKEIVAGVGYYGHGAKDPMSYRQALDHIQQNYMLKLGAAKFKITCVDLVPAAGSCMTCTKRTGHDPDLFSEVKDADVCIDPPCFHKKEEAHALQVVKAAQDNGQNVIAGKEAAELATGPSYASKFKGYRRLDSAEDSPTSQPLRKIIGTQMAADGIKPTMIESIKGELVACLPNDVALRLLKTVEGHAQAAKTVAKEVREFANEKKAKADAKAKAAYEQDWRDQLVARTWGLMQHSDDIVMAFNAEVHRYVALKTATNLSTDQSAKVGKLLGLDKVGTHSALLDHIKTSAEPDAIHMLMIMVRDSSANDFSYSDRIANEGMHLVAGIVLGDSLKSTTKDIQAESLAKYFPKVKEEKAKLATAPAARPEVGAGGTTNEVRGKGPVSKKSPPRAAKLSAEDATLGIAAAMQGLVGAASAPVGAVALPAEPVGVIDEGQYTTAVNIVVVQQQASISHIQRMLNIGYNAAAGLLERMETEGIVSPMQPDGKRKVLKSEASSREVLTGRIKVLVGKYKGKEGTILEDQGDDCYRVKIDRVSVASSFMAGQIEAVTV
jgi:ParB/RepB/Spo0J family partition protein